MNHLAIIGNLTRDPESRSVGDKTVCNFTVAVNRRRKAEGQPDADFFRVAAWGHMGENCQKFLSKGRKVSVVGTVSVRPYLDKEGKAAASLEVFAEDVEFLSSAAGGGEAAASQAGPDVNMTPVDVGDSLPF